MRNYGQYCPIARASEILAERWTPIILRNIHLGCHTFTQIADGAPGISRTVLTTRLRQLEHAGVINAEPVRPGRGFRYTLTDAGSDLWDVLIAIGTWGERWLDLAPDHVDPGVVLWSWCNSSLRHDLLPARRVVVELEFPDQPKSSRRFWFVIDGLASEICRTHPGFEVDLIVIAEAIALAQWHLGRLEWADAIRSQRIEVRGPRQLARLFPTWNKRSFFADVEPKVSVPG